MKISAPDLQIEGKKENWKKWISAINSAVELLHLLTSNFRAIVRI